MEALGENWGARAGVVGFDGGRIIASPLFSLAVKWRG